MDFMKKLNLEANKLTKKVKDKANNVSMDAKIYEQEKKIKELSIEIGNLVVKAMDEGVNTFGEDVQERYEAILKVREEIKELEAKKIENEDKNDVVCSNCGKVVAEGMNFCGNCGTKVDVDDDVDNEDEDDKEEEN